jgi:hypothetical protein
MTEKDETDWRARWAADRLYATRAAVAWATGLVASGTPPILVADALAAASEAVRNGVDATAADILVNLNTDAASD